MSIYLLQFLVKNFELILLDCIDYKLLKYVYVEFEYF